ncbi:MAG: hypothetical protein GXP31_19115 [Kiritimatiellaeota bacterium]|nr:hypothetical protein [Kiritimatiellota bacterium]
MSQSRFATVLIAVLSCFQPMCVPAAEPNDNATRPSARQDRRKYFIDFENGDDRNSGARDAPWRHHPWDKNATGNAAEARGVATYVFKKGVIYRGSLVARDSGEPGNPIVLTAEPNWGKGKAWIFGSERIVAGWKRCNDKQCAKIPKKTRGATWYQDLTLDYVPMMAYELRGSTVTAMNIARAPNWTISDPDDPRKEWWEFTNTIVEYRITLDNVDGFKVGDAVFGSGKWVDRWGDKLNIDQGVNRIVDLGDNWIIVRVEKKKKGEFSKDAKVTNGKTTHTIQKIKKESRRFQDRLHLTQSAPDYWRGGVIWFEGSATMPIPRIAVIDGYDPARNEISFESRWGADQYCRYFIEGLPQLLDATNEWCYVKNGRNKGRIYIRLNQNRNPNTAIIEIAKHRTFLSIDGRKHILVRNLHLRFFNAYDSREPYKARNPMYYSSVFRITGDSGDISILECEIEHSSQGISLFPNGSNQLLDDFKFNRNRIADLECNAITCSLTEQMWELRNKGVIGSVRQSRIKHVQVSGNRIQNCGFRTQNFNPVGVIGLRGAELVEISHNIVDTAYEPGILVKNGGYYEQQWHHYRMDYPLSRTFIFGNVVTNTVLAAQDYGGIASWHGGPVYIYNNISGNAVGAKYAEKKKFPNKKDWYRTGCYAPAIYLDQGYKHYVFNNILWGKNNNENDWIYNSVAFNEAEGFMNVVFNNTMYNCAVGLHKGMGMHNRCYYLNNLFIAIGERYIDQEVYGKNIGEALQYDSLAYAGNVFCGHGRGVFGRLRAGKDFSTLSDWVRNLKKQKAMVAGTGVVTGAPQVMDAEKHDFRPRRAAVCIDKAKKVFVPWGLYKVVGEWGFYQHPADVTRILDEHINWNKDWSTRVEVRAGRTPRYDLKAHGVGGSNFRAGILEDWVKGALSLDGERQYCSLEARECRLLDMDANNFLVEVVVLVPQNETDGPLVVKRDRAKGYSLLVEGGRLKMRLDFGTETCSRWSAVRINDGQWRHVVVEVDRNKQEGINIYVDGKLRNGRFGGRMNADTSLRNSGDFNVGRDGTGGYLACTLDFLRVSRGTLAQAETTIEELYDWEFNGPFLKDFYGRPTLGKARDTGAIEYVPGTN